jgi:putative inorganic carbon (HCO3(-)) transporter
MQTKYTALSAYCIFLEIALETGILGIFSFLAMIVATVIRGLKLIRSFKIINNIQAMWVIASLASMAGLATQGLFDTVWYRPQVNTLWWLCVAIIAAISLSPISPSIENKNHNN